MLQGPVLFAIDDYPALCLPATDYGISTSEVSRRQLSTSELRLTAALHMMMREAPKRGLSVCAAHGSTTISHLQPVPINGAAVLPLHRYNHAEVHSALAWYTAQVWLPCLKNKLTSMSCCLASAACLYFCRCFGWPQTQIREPTKPQSCISAIGHGRTASIPIITASFLQSEIHIHQS